MKFILVLLALFTPILCADYVPKRQEMSAGPAVNVPMSIAEVIATALPSSLVSAIVANPVSFADALSSQFAAGHTPAWYSNLPDSVKSQVIPPGLAAAPSPTTAVVVSINDPLPVVTQLPGLTGTSGPMQTGVFTSINFSTLPHVVLTLPGPRPAATSNTTSTQHASTTTVTKTSSSVAMTGSSYNPPTRTSSDSFSSSFSGQASPTSTTGGAVARPIAALGAGLAGLVGALGIAAL